MLARVKLDSPVRQAVDCHVDLRSMEAEEAALELLSLGAAAICVHSMTRFIDGALSDDEWLAADIKILSRCDAVVVTGNWFNSDGTMKEIETAMELGLPVFFMRHAESMHAFGEYLNAP